MTIETLFNVTDIAWVELDKLPRKVRISRIQVNVSSIGFETTTRIWYEYDNNESLRRESDFFKTKEALLQSL